VIHFVTAPQLGDRSCDLWRAIRVTCEDCSGKEGFNPRPRVAGDDLRLVIRPSSRRFQSAPACGGRRRRPRAQGPAQPRFNPRPRVAGDNVRACASPRSGEFQSAPACGGRRSVHTTMSKNSALSFTHCAGSTSHSTLNTARAGHSLGRREPPGAGGACRPRSRSRRHR
jgi:hypothetical protein